MAQLIPTVPGTGAAFGSGFSSGLSRTMNAFTEAKIKQMLEGPQNELIAKINSFISGAPPGQAGQAGQQVQPSIDQLSGQQQQAPQQQASQGRPQISREQFAEILKGVPAHLQAPLVANFIAQEKAQATEKWRQKEFDLKREAQTFKEVGKPLDDLRRTAHQAEKEIPLLEQAIYAFEHGDPGTGPSRAILGKLGLQDVFTNPTLQLLEQYRQQWSTGASSAFDTGNLTNQEVGSYKNVMFSLTSDPKSNLVQLKNLLLERATTAAQNKARKDIIRENGGVTPRDILDQISERTADTARKNYDQAMKNVQDFISGQTGRAPAGAQSAPQAGGGGGAGGSGILEKIAPSGGLLDILGRGVPRTFARAAESLYGLPGDISSLGLGAANYLSGGAIPTYAQVQEKLPISYPTSEQIRSKLKDVTGGVLEPRGKVEELADNIASDFATIALSPGSALASNFLKTVGANAAAFFTKELGGGPLAQTGAKVGFSILAGIPGMRKGLADTMEKSYDAARTAAKGATIETGSLSKQAGQIFDNASKGDSPAKKFIQERAKAVEKVTRNGKASVDELTQLKRDLNQHLKEATSMPKEAQASVKKLVGGVVDTLKDYGKKNPQFGENFFKAEDIFKGLAAQSKLTTFLEKYLSPTSIKSPVVKALVYGPATLHSPVKAVGAAGSAFAAQQLSSTFDLFKASKEARKAYTDLLTEAAKNNGPAAARAATKLDKIAQKEGI